jgi:hypothetical protein
MSRSSSAHPRLRASLGGDALRATGGIPLQRPPAAAAPKSVQAPGAVPAPGAAPLDGLGQITALVGDGFAGLRRTHRSPRRALIWAFWLLGIVGDGATTLAMIRSGEFVEANPAAALGMGFVGLSGYVVLVSLICMLFAVVSTGRPQGPVARTAVGFLLLVAAGKLFMAISNLLLWASLP